MSSRGSVQTIKVRNFNKAKIGSQLTDNITRTAHLDRKILACAQVEWLKRMSVGTSEKVCASDLLSFFEVSCVKFSKYYLHRSYLKNVFIWSLIFRSTFSPVFKIR